MLKATAATVLSREQKDITFEWRTAHHFYLLSHDGLYFVPQ